MSGGVAPAVIVSNSRGYGYTLKRPLDILAAAALLILLAPLFLVIACFVRWHLGPPILYRQERPGLHQRMFTLVKFRSMVEPTSENQKLSEDRARLTAFGSRLRRSSLDELPELWNVLRGDMSLVGPRPLLPRYLPFYSDREGLRHAVRPGITGWAQVNGRNRLDWNERLEMDVWYVEHLTLRLDLRILARTLSMVWRRMGIDEVPGERMRDLDAERIHDRR